MFIGKKITHIKPKKNKVVIQISGGEKFYIAGANGVTAEFIGTNESIKSAKGEVCDCVNIAQDLHMQEITGAGTIVGGIAVLALNQPGTDKFLRLKFKVFAPLEMADTEKPFLEIYSESEKKS